MAARGCFGVDIRGLSPHFLSFEFLRQFALQAAPFPRFEGKRVSLHVFDDAFLLDLSFKTAQGASMDSPSKIRTSAKLCLP